MRNVIESLRRPTLALAVAALTACGGDAAPSRDDPDTLAMSRGVALLYESADPFGAETAFREVLQRTPAHYGARYQLAVALDSAGKPTESRPEWQEMLRLAEAIGDTAVVQAAQARLVAPDTVSQPVAMRLGLHLLYTQNDAPAAVEQFRALLRRNATHYGATYQLATALDRAGRGDEARPVWVRVLGMAVSSNDTATAATARARLR